VSRLLRHLAATHCNILQHTTTHSSSWLSCETSQQSARRHVWRLDSWDVSRVAPHVRHLKSATRETSQDVSRVALRCALYMCAASTGAHSQKSSFTVIFHSHFSGEQTFETSCVWRFGVACTCARHQLVNFRKRALFLAALLRKETSDLSCGASVCLVRVRGTHR